MEIGQKFSKNKIQKELLALLSSQKAMGNKTRPPKVNCQAVKTIKDTRGFHFLTSTVPSPIAPALVRAAIIPTVSSLAAEERTNYRHCRQILVSFFGSKILWHACIDWHRETKKKISLFSAN